MRTHLIPDPNHNIFRETNRFRIFEHSFHVSKSAKIEKGKAVPWDFQDVHILCMMFPDQHMDTFLTCIRVNVVTKENNVYDSFVHLMHY